MKFPGLAIRISKAGEFSQPGRTVCASIYLCCCYLRSACPQKGQETRVQERNREVARSFFEEVLGQGHLNKYAESHAKNSVKHGENHEYALEEDMATAKDEHNALPDKTSQGQPYPRGTTSGGDVLDFVRYEHPGRNGYSGNGQEDQNDGMTLFRFKAG